MKNTVNTIPGSYPVLSPIEQYIFRYVHENAHDSAMMTIRSLAAAAGVSTMSIMRLVRKFGYEGYADFKISLAEHPEEIPFPVKDIKDFDLNNFFENTARSSAYEKSLCNAAALIARSHTVLFGGDRYGACISQAGIQLFSGPARKTGMLAEAGKIKNRRDACAVIITGSLTKDESQAMKKELPYGRIPLIIIRCGGWPIQLPNGVIDCTDSCGMRSATSLVPAIHTLEELRKRMILMS